MRLPRLWSPKGFVSVAAVVWIAYAMSGALRGGDAMSVLSGTLPEGAGSLWGAASRGLVHGVLHFAAVLACPPLVFAAVLWGALGRGARSARG